MLTPELIAEVFGVEAVVLDESDSLRIVIQVRWRRNEVNKHEELMILYGTETGNSELLAIDVASVGT